VRRSGVTFAVTIALVLLADQLTKAAVRSAIPFGRSIPILGGLAFLTHAENTGGAFSILTGTPWLFVAVSSTLIVAALIWFVVKRPTDLLLVLGLGLLIGGAAGNLVDRVTFGYVTDFLDVRIWPVFNVADSGVVVGTGLIVLASVLADLRASRESHRSDGADDPPTGAS